MRLNFEHSGSGWHFLQEGQHMFLDFEHNGSGWHFLQECEHRCPRGAMAAGTLPPRG